MAYGCLPVGSPSHLNLCSKAFAILQVRFWNPAIFWPGFSNMYKRHLVGLLSNHLATNMVRISRSTATVCDRHFVLADHLGRIFSHPLHYNVRLPNQFGVDSHQWHQQHFFRLCEACAISQQRVFCNKALCIPPAIKHASWDSRKISS